MKHFTGYLTMAENLPLNAHGYRAGQETSFLKFIKKLFIARKFHLISEQLQVLLV
jgi:hypothetical protein